MYDHRELWFSRVFAHAYSEGFTDAWRGSARARLRVRHEVWGVSRFAYVLRDACCLLGTHGLGTTLFLSTEERRDCVLSVNAPCALSRAGVSCASVHEPEQSAPREQCDSVDEEMRRPHTDTRGRGREID